MMGRFFTKVLVICLTMLIAFPAGANIVERSFLFHFDRTPHRPENIGLPEMQVMNFQRLVLWVHKPEAGKPSVLYFHGNAGNLASRRDRFRAFIDKGYGVVAMAYPGSTGSKGRQDGRVIQQLANSLMATMGRIVGDSPVVVYGESLGTGVAIQAVASAQSAPPAGVVLEAPYTSIHDLARTYVPKIANAVTKIPDPWPSEQYVGALTMPLLVMHGTADAVIPYAMGEAMFTAAPSNDKRFVNPRGGAHDNLWGLGGKAALFEFLAKF
ncbi:MAG: alpha/beta hydrolase [Maritimibacter sp.]